MQVRRNHELRNEHCSEKYNHAIDISIPKSKVKRRGGNVGYRLFLAV